MLKILATIALVLLFSGCSDKTQYAPNEKIYQGEDRDILYGLELSKAGYYEDAATYFGRLYDKTQRVAYLREKVKMLISAKQYEAARNQAQSYEKDDIVLNRFIVLSYLKQNKLDQALVKAKQNTKTSNRYKDYKLVADIYLGKKEYENAFNYLQSAYAKQQTLEALLPMVKILVSYLDKQSDAIAYLQTYIKTHGFNEEALLQLLSIYSKNENVQGMKAALTSLYTNTRKKEYAQKLLSIYGYEKNSKDAIEFLRNSGYDDTLLFDLYKEREMYQKALDLAKQRYKQTADPKWIAREAILLYEMNSSLEKIVQTFQKALDEGVKQPQYLNYYGYLLIDHEIDIEKGIKLVKKALQKEPGSVFYIDSLAWGYYKLGECEKAKEFLPRLKKDDSEEIIEHIQKIQRCKE
ncbi:MAG: tetratricopeptide repeat protein [Campylobacterota bacterium]